MLSRKSCFIIAAIFSGFAPEAMAAAANKIPAPAAAKPARDKITVAAKAKPVAAEAQRGVLNGYKGYHYHRPGYKSNGDGWWYPRAAFPPKSSKALFLRRPAAWAKGGGAANKAPSAGRKIYAAFGLSAAHHRWCAARFPAYNSADNIYTAAGGRKRVCLSPYLEKEPQKK